MNDNKDYLEYVSYINYTDYSKSLKEFGNRFLNFSLRVNNIGIQDFSSNYFLIGSQEQIYKKFDKYINEFYE